MNKKLTELDFSSRTASTGGTDLTQEKIWKKMGNKFAAATQPEMSAAKGEFAKVIRKKFAGLDDTSDERIHTITMDMIQRIDLDHSGQVDYEEFYEFFANNDEFIVSNESIRDMFQEFDKDTTDEEATINMEEFAAAIKSALYATEPNFGESSVQECS